MRNARFYRIHEGKLDQEDTVRNARLYRIHLGKFDSIRYMKES